MEMDEEILIQWNYWWTSDRRREDDYVHRDLLDEVEWWLDRREAIPIIGCRRAGKTTILSMTICHLLRSVPKENILFIKCDDERVPHTDLIDRARSKHQELFNPSGRIYIFLDEIQALDRWPQTIKRIYDLERETKVLMSGSTLFTGDLATALAGRYVAFDLYPFSFAEFLRANGLEPTNRTAMLAETATIRHLLREYLYWGGFPEVVLEPDEAKKRTLLRFYSDSILYRDVIAHGGITKPATVEKLKSYLLANFTNLLNYSTIAEHLAVAADTVTAYLAQMEASFFIFAVPLFAYSVKKQQINPKKIYCIDNGLRNAAGFKFSRDLGRLYENAVFLELKRRGGEIYYWRDRKGEVDFCIKRGDTITDMIQVCSNIETAGEREEDALLRGMERFEVERGTVITGDTRTVMEHGSKTIRYLPLWEWLLEEGVRD